MIEYKVKSIKKEETREWCLKKHYAHRMPMAVEYSFGLYSSKLEGICIFGPTAPPVPITIFSQQRKHKVRELTRLIINEGLNKNALSFFVGKCLKLLPFPMCIVSFSDKGQGHHGYIYQATNWIYTGEGGERFSFYSNKGEKIHSLTINDNAALERITQNEYLRKHNIIKKESLPKYRYLYFLGNKSEKKEMFNDLKLPVLKYPKGKNERYDASYNPTVQLTLF